MELKDCTISIAPLSKEGYTNYEKLIIWTPKQKYPTFICDLHIDILKEWDSVWLYLIAVGLDIKGTQEEWEDVYGLAKHYAYDFDEEIKEIKYLQ